MRSFSILCAIALFGGRAGAAAPAQGFAVERLYPSAPGAGWFVMDALDIHGELGGAMSLSLGYAYHPLTITNGAQHLTVVSDQANADVGAALTYRRFRFYLNLDVPLALSGESGAVGTTSFVSPMVNPGSTPDILSDVRLGADVRIFGRADGPFRFGAGAQLYVPFGQRSDYVTDGTFRGAIRALAAGNLGAFVYAAQLGVHIRPFVDPAPGAPKGSELLFGVAAGAKVYVGHGGNWAVVVGPEVFGATAFRTFLETNGTALEGMISGRIEGTRENKAQLRVKLAAGSAFNYRFGAADWRLVVGVELFGQSQRSKPRP